MAEEEFNMDQLIPAGDAARALGISVRTMNYWLRTGEVNGEQSVTGRWWVPIGELFRLLSARGFAGKPAESRLRERLARDVLPKFPGARGPGDKDGAATSTNVLSLS